MPFPSGFPSGSTLKVLLLNGAAPNTGPFDLYINSISSSGNLIANDVPKATLSGSGYEFVTPLETTQVWAKSDGTITNADVYSLGSVPGANLLVTIDGAYDSSLTVSAITASVFLDNGYGLQSAGTIPSALNTCPATTAVGLAFVNSVYNTLVVVKDNESGSNYIKFFADGAATSDYYYHLPGSPINANDVSICVDLSGNSYQTVATNSINVYPTSSITITPFNYYSPIDVESWIIVKSNGVVVASSSYSDQNLYTTSFSVPGNAYIEVTSSAVLSSGNNAYTCSFVDIAKLTYSPLYSSFNVVGQNNAGWVSPSSSASDFYSLYALPGGVYDIIPSSSFGSGVFVGKYPFSTSLLSCGATGPLANIFLNTTDYAIYVSNGNTLQNGMTIFGSIELTTWAGGSGQLYDPNNTTIFDVSVGGTLTTSTIC